MHALPPIPRVLRHRVELVRDVLDAAAHARADAEAHAGPERVVAHGHVARRHGKGAALGARAGDDGDVVVAAADVVVLDEHVHGRVDVDAVRVRALVVGAPRRRDVDAADDDVARIDRMQRPEGAVQHCDVEQRQARNVVRLHQVRPRCAIDEGWPPPRTGSVDDARDQSTRGA